ncbi:DUF4214 domain-containing protein [Subtercola sp. PAMC28395]|uniref:DUF4214 domain-containing protein n=1 Tax=Subtercola sp. PAMC28395 TaxID=2846775 RepID=UPI001C0C43E5|nr:DUF4214 domain-containing protein [Subtercola sp. PAMC28395]QWT24187.1 DUF4214 domain-containing protein [Subtercola sp. PAMC28395]
MKLFTAAVAVIVMVGAGFISSPAIAAEKSAGITVTGSPSHSDIVAPPASPPQGEVAATHPLVTPSDISASANSSTQGKSSASSTAAIGGFVTLASTSAPMGSGITVVAILFDDVTGAIKFTSETKTASDGSFSIQGLAPADYWLLFYDDTKPGVPTVQWYGSSEFDPYGSSLPVADGQSVSANWALTPSGEVLGSVSCEGCDAPPASADVVIYIAKFDPSRNDWFNVASAQPDSAGRYDVQVLYPGSYYSYARFNGSSEFSNIGFSRDYTVNARSAVSADVIIPRLITPVSGVQPAINSVVNALYFDFLTRFPSAHDITFWNGQFAGGSDPGAVATGFVTSDEYRLIRINAAYQTILGRGADPAGRLDWLHWMQQGRITTDDIETSFYASDEYFNKQGGTNKQFVNAIYQTLLHRGGTDTDYAFWSNLVQQHDRAWVIARFWDSTETISERVSLMYAHYLGRTPDPSGLATWVGLALQIGDSGLRAGLTGSDEYFIRSQYRFSEH